MRLGSLFASLTGRWRFFRVFNERTTGASLGTASGEVNFVPQGKNVLHYLEKGEVTNPLGERVQAYREYLFKYNEQRDEIAKHYAKDGKDDGLFYLLKFDHSSAYPKAVSATGDHLCVKDFYKATYEFFTNNEGSEAINKFTLKYDVTGPNKNYITDTTFEKEGIKSHY